MRNKIISLVLALPLCAGVVVSASPAVAKDADRIKCVREAGVQTLQIVGTPSVEKGVTIKGTGWCSDYDEGGSGAATVAIKLNKGAVQHIDTSIHENKGVWQIITDADPKTGTFEKTIPLPDGASTGFTATNSKFNVKDFTVTALSGSLGEHDMPGSVTQVYQEIFRPTSDNVAPLITDLNQPEAFSKLGDVFLRVTKDGRAIKAYLPEAAPGDVVYVSGFDPMPGLDFRPEFLPDADKAFVKNCSKVASFSTDAWYLAEYRRDIYWRVDEDRTVTLPLYSEGGKKLERGGFDQLNKPLTYGPVYLTFNSIKPGDGATDESGNEKKNEFLGSAWITNLGFGDKKERESSDPHAIPHVVVGLRPDLMPEGWEATDPNDKWGTCTFRNPNRGGLTATVAATPSVNVNREITVPDLPTVHYSIDGKDVSGSVAIDDDSEHDVVVKAVAADGYRLVGADDKGVVEFTVHVPKKVVPVTETPAPVTMIIAPDPVTSTVTPAPVTTTWSAEPVTETTTAAVTTTVERTVEPTKDGAGSSESSDGNFGSGVLTGVGAITAVVAVLFAVLSSSGLMPSLFPANTPVVVKR